VEIIYHAHHAVMSNGMRARADKLVRKLGARLSRPVDAIVRFEQDGPVRRVEIALHAPRRRAIVAEGTARTYGPALAEAAKCMETKIARMKRTPKSRARQVAKA
jgi:ribosome-associated translation inhibitor RaiA